MEHVFYLDGNAKKISWTVKTGDSIVNEMRDHADIYLDKVNVEQSKYIAMHVGLFWSIGTFTIKNEDTVNVMLDSKSMYDHLTNNSQNTDRFIEMKTGFIKKFIAQRKLKVNYQFIDQKENLATNLL